MTTISKLVEQRKTEARTAFAQAAWDGKEVTELARVAEEAGLPPAEADAILDQVNAARDLCSVAEPVERYRTAHAKAKKAEEKAVAEAEELEARAEQIRDVASDKVTDAWNKMIEAESAVNTLANRHAADPLIVPVSVLPASVQKTLDRRSGEKQQQAQDAAQRKRAVRIDALERELAETKHRFELNDHMPQGGRGLVNLDRREMKREHQAEIKRLEKVIEAEKAKR